MQNYVCFRRHFTKNFTKFRFRQNFDAKRILYEFYDKCRCENFWAQIFFLSFDENKHDEFVVAVLVNKLELDMLLRT